MAVFRKLQIRWGRTGADVAVSHQWFRADPADQEGAVEALLDTWWNAIKDRFTDDTALWEYRWYFAGDPPPFPPADWGPADRFTPRDLGGTATGNPLPPQCAVVVTKTLPAPFRRNQGRFYLPNPAVSFVDGTGRLDSATVTDFANATKTLYDGCEALGYYPCIIAKHLGENAVYFPRSIRIDNDIDTQRRRGHDTSTFTETRVPATGVDWGPL